MKLCDGGLRKKTLGVVGPNQHTDQTSPFTNKPQALVLGFQTEVKKNWKKIKGKCEIS